ncbi:hypothetical protein PanWU01x14_262690 [Parasponia andersonii]|uniref:Uncharacterized protein n=1 Tax=Parasponia andersonii TaxID=3476 RepID=A0A2P5B889_PARAD|nr:hypothetical protein PanWU01x14_262690 [Parasponia andersonii]
MSLADDPRKRTKRKEMRNQNLPADLIKIILRGSRHLPMTRENVRRGSSYATRNLPTDLIKIVLWESHRALKCYPMARKNIRRGKSCTTKNLPADLIKIVQWESYRALKC